MARNAQDINFRAHALILGDLGYKLMLSYQGSSA